MSKTQRFDAFERSNRGLHLTKRQKKLVNGPNHAVRYSLQKGVDLPGGYVGDTPKFGEAMNPETKVMEVKQLSRGIPFVHPSNFSVPY